MLDRVAAALLLALLVGCPESPPVDDDDNDTDDDDTVDSPPLGEAAGVHIVGVTISQGVQRDLLDAGGPVDDDLPLVAGRDTLIRVHCATDGDYDGQAVTGRLTVGSETIEVEGSLDEESAQDDLDSTINFEIPGDLVADPLTWSASLLQPGGEGNPDATEAGEVEIEGAANVFRMVIAPFSYEFDGSGRVPDTSPEQLERIRQTFLKLYPVSDVEITVREAQPITTELSPNGDGWFLAGIPLLNYRQEDGAADDVYYYGMFNPAETLQDFCGFGGCLLGVTLLNDNPPDVGSVTLRVALGVGFVERAPWVAVHEIGHAHGRPHSPCGPQGNMPADVDPNFPYSDGTIGRWGWDLVEGELVPPETTDYMGYCADQWTSDWTWRAMHARGQNVNEGFGAPGPLTTWDVVAIDRQGAHWGTAIDRRSAYAGEDVAVSVDGEPTVGRFVRWDHMPGGLLVFPRGQGAPSKAEFTLDGESYRADR